MEPAHALALHAPCSESSQTPTTMGEQEYAHITRGLRPEPVRAHAHARGAAIEPCPNELCLARLPQPAHLRSSEDREVLYLKTAERAHDRRGGGEDAVLDADVPSPYGARSVG